MSHSFYLSKPLALMIFLIVFIRISCTISSTNTTESPTVSSKSPLLSSSSSSSSTLIVYINNNNKGNNTNTMNGSLEYPFGSIEMGIDHLNNNILKNQDEISKYDSIIMALYPGRYEIRLDNPMLVNFSNIELNFSITGLSHSTCEDKTLCQDAIILNFINSPNGLNIEYNELTNAIIMFNNLAIMFDQGDIQDLTLFTLKIPNGVIIIQNIYFLDTIGNINSDKGLFILSAKQTLIKDITIINCQFNQVLFSSLSTEQAIMTSSIQIHNIHVVNVLWANQKSSFITLPNANNITVINATIDRNEGNCHIFSIQNNEYIYFENLIITNTNVEWIIFSKDNHNINMINITYVNNQNKSLELDDNQGRNGLAKIYNPVNVTLDGIHISNINTIQKSIIDITYSNNKDHPLAKIDFLNSSFEYNQLEMKDNDYNIHGIIKIEARDAIEPHQITLSNINFTDNKIITHDEKSIECTTNSSSTLLIYAPNAKILSDNLILTNNIAPRRYNNLYIKANEFMNNQSAYYSNIMSNWDSTLQLSEILQGCRMFVNLNINSPLITIANSTFSGNYADVGGALRYFNTSNLNNTQYNLINNEFSFNYAYKGGAFYSNITDQNQTFLNILNNRFYNNDAKMKSPHIHLAYGYNNIKQPNNNTFFMKKLTVELYLSQSTKYRDSKNSLLKILNNTKNIENDPIQHPEIYESNSLELNNIKTGEIIPFHMEFVIKDKLSNEVICPKCFGIIIKLIENYSPVQWPDSRFLYDKSKNDKMISSGRVIISNPIFFYSPLSNHTLAIGFMRRISMESTSKDTLAKFVMPIKLNSIIPPEMNCSKGYFYDLEKGNCALCPPGTYILKKNSIICQSCPLEANCSLGGDNLSLFEGYWRDIQNDTSQINYCEINPLACLGGTQSICQEAYTGPICGKCQDLNDRLDNTSNTTINLGKYAKFSRDICLKCGFDSIFDLGLVLCGILLGFVFTLFILRLVTVNNHIMNLGEGGSAKRLKITLLTHLLVSYFSAIYIFRGIEVYLPLWLNTLTSIIITSTYQIWGICLCMLRSIGTNIPYDHILLYIFIVIMKIIIIIAFMRGAGSLLHMTMKKRLFSLIVTLLSMEIISTLDFLLSYVDCYKIDGISRPRVNMEAQCDGEYYTDMKWHLIYPLVVLWSIVIPYLITGCVGKSTSILDDDSSLRLRAFIFGYSDDLIKGEQSIEKYSLFFETYSPLLLLAAGNITQTYTWKSICAIFLYCSLLILSAFRKFTFYSDFRRYLQMILRFILLITLKAGTYQEFWVTMPIWILNIIFILAVLISIGEIIMETTIRSLFTKSIDINLKKGKYEEPSNNNDNDDDNNNNNNTFNNDSDDDDDDDAILKDKNAIELNELMSFTSKEIENCKSFDQVSS